MNATAETNPVEEVLLSMWRFLSESKSDTTFWRRHAGYDVELADPAHDDSVTVFADESIHGIRELSSPLSDS